MLVRSVMTATTGVGPLTIRKSRRRHLSPKLCMYTCTVRMRWQPKWAGIPQPGASGAAAQGLVLALACRPLPALAQSPFAAAHADGSIVLPEQGGFVRAWLDETLFKVAFQVDRTDEIAGARRKDVPAEVIRFLPHYGFELQGRPSGNAAALFRSDNLISGARASLSFGLKNVLTSQPSAVEIAAAAAGVTERSWNSGAGRCARRPTARARQPPTRAPTANG